MYTFICVAKGPHVICTPLCSQYNPVCPAWREQLSIHTSLDHLQLRPLTAMLAKLFPDAAMRRQMAAREVIFDTSTALLDGWQAHTEMEVAGAGGRASLLNPVAKPPLPMSTAEAASGSVRDDSASQLMFNFPFETSGAKGGDRGSAKAGCLSGIAPGSFLGLMLEARQRGTGEKLTDMQVCMI